MKKVSVLVFGIFLSSAVHATSCETPLSSIFPESANLFERIGITGRDYSKLTNSEIKSAYRSAVKLYHPDIAGPTIGISYAKAMTQNINLAFETLKDERSRLQYIRISGLNKPPAPKPVSIFKSTPISSIYDPEAFNSSSSDMQASIIQKRKDDSDSLKKPLERSLFASLHYARTGKVSPLFTLFDMDELVEPLDVKNNSRDLWELVLNDSLTIEHFPKAITKRINDRLSVFPEVGYRQKAQTTEAKRFLGWLLTIHDIQGDPNFANRFQFLAKFEIAQIVAILDTFPAFAFGNDDERYNRLMQKAEPHLFLLEHLIQRAPRQTLASNIIKNLLPEMAKEVKSHHLGFRQLTIYIAALFNAQIVEGKALSDEDWTSPDGKIAKLSPEFSKAWQFLKERDEEDRRIRNAKTVLQQMENGKLPLANNVSDAINLIFNEDTLTAYDRATMKETLKKAFMKNLAWMGEPTFASIAKRQPAFDKFLDEVFRGL